MLSLKSDSLKCYPKLRGVHQNTFFFVFLLILIFLLYFVLSCDQITPASIHDASLKWLAHPVNQLLIFLFLLRLTQEEVVLVRLLDDEPSRRARSRALKQTLRGGGNRLRRTLCTPQLLDGLRWPADRVRSRGRQGQRRRVRGQPLAGAYEPGAAHAWGACASARQAARRGIPGAAPPPPQRREDKDVCRHHCRHVRLLALLGRRGRHRNVGALTRSLGRRWPPRHACCALVTPTGGSRLPPLPRKRGKER